MNWYAWDKNKQSLARHCKRIGRYWSTLPESMKYSDVTVRAFKDGLRERGLPEKDVQQAYVDTLGIARLKMVARGH